MDIIIGVLLCIGAIGEPTEINFDQLKQSELNRLETLCNAYHEVDQHTHAQSPARDQLKQKIIVLIDEFED